MNKKSIVDESTNTVHNSDFETVSDKITPSVQDVSNVLAKATGMKLPKAPTKKQLDKQVKEAKKYWNSMITRREAQEMMDRAVEPYTHQLRLMFIQIKTLTDFVVQKGLTTREELDQLSIPIANEIYGIQPESQDEAVPEKEKEEATEKVAEE